MEAGRIAISTGPASSTCCLVMLVQPVWQKHFGWPSRSLFTQRSTATSELLYRAEQRSQHCSTDLASEPSRFLIGVSAPPVHQPTLL